MKTHIDNTTCFVRHNHSVHFQYELIIGNAILRENAYHYLNTKTKRECKK